MQQTGEIILYQPDENVELEVRLEEETVWLTQQQMTLLFETTKQNVSLHINNIFKEEELSPISTVKEYLTVQQEGKRLIKRSQKYYNLDVIISVGYRVKSRRGTQFRIWANKVLKDYLLKGYAINQRLTRIETQLENQQALLAEHSEKIDFFVRTSLPPVEGIFYNGQVFDAHNFVSGLIRNAKTRIVLIDNYVDDTVLKLLDKRSSGIKATIYTKQILPALQNDINLHNAQYEPIDVQIFADSHDRFLMIDETVYHIGASLKDLGRKWFAFSKMEISSALLLSKINT
ncbi:MAG: virulence RhuM family protein [Bacteroidales bacterium]|nr:virulence RhuM family protein [Bacteroidales bacterium]